MPIKDSLIGGAKEIWNGLFGLSKPYPQNSDPAFIQGDTVPEGGYYPMIEGPVFTPGTGNYFMLPRNDQPITPYWGRGFLVQQPYAFRVVPEPPIISQPNTTTAGLGGLQSGQIVMPPLIVPAPEQGG
jgi:hypothetical protein